MLLLFHECVYLSDSFRHPLPKHPVYNKIEEKIYISKLVEMFGAGYTYR